MSFHNHTQALLEQRAQPSTCADAGHLSSAILAEDCPLIDAILTQNPLLAKALLVASRNERLTPLSFAIYLRKQKSFTALLSHCGPSACDQFLNRKNCTPLMIAAFCYEPDAALFFIRSILPHSDVNLQDSLGSTALEIAINAASAYQTPLAAVVEIASHMDLARTVDGRAIMNRILSRGVSPDVALILHAQAEQEEISRSAREGFSTGEHSAGQRMRI